MKTPIEKRLRMEEILSKSGENRGCLVVKNENSTEMRLTTCGSVLYLNSTRIWNKMENLE